MFLALRSPRVRRFLRTLRVRRRPTEASIPRSLVWLRGLMRTPWSWRAPATAFAGVQGAGQND
eukprot:9091911-Pyramimonas_sp.AAC.1